MGVTCDSIRAGALALVAFAWLGGPAAAEATAAAPNVDAPNATLPAAAAPADAAPVAAPAPAPTPRRDAAGRRCRPRSTRKRPRR